MKQLMQPDELIAHMKEKGITFNEMSEQEAKEFLTNNNYYMKLSAYRKNYEKQACGKNKGKYVNLDFAYIKELSTIDMHLRYIIIEMCLDIEHWIKVRLLNEITCNPDEDGYELIKKFLAKDKNFKILKKISLHKSGEYCKDLISKYYPYFPAWVFVELISFGDLVHLCAFYTELYGKPIFNSKLMNVIRDIRNAAAHSNCLLNKLTEKNDGNKQPHSDITSFIKGITSISKDARQKYLNTQFTYSFITLIYIYNELGPEVVKKKRFKQLKEFMENRVLQNKGYFSSEQRIKGFYEFHKKVIDSLQ